LGRDIRHPPQTFLFAEQIMGILRPDVTGRAVSDVEPLMVSPRQACRLLSIGNTRLYELIAAGEIESYRDGRSRRITLASIRTRIARLLANVGAPSTLPPNSAPRRRGRPRKIRSTT
jgi:excisionase family DNA binding protein